MPHFGKIYPRQWINFVIAEDAPTTPGPTRKGVLFSTGITLGTIADLWDATTTISDVAIRDPADPIATLYRFELESDPLAVITVSVKFLPINPFPTGGTRYYWQTKSEAFYNGTFLGRRTNDQLGNWASLWKNPTSDGSIGSEWFDRTDTPAWWYCSFYFGAAYWDQQPEFHPYRHEP